MSVHSVLATLTSVSAYPATPQVDLPFLPDSLYLKVESGTPGVLVSFDGVNDHLHVVSTDLLVLVRTRCRKVWLKEDGAGASTFRVSAFTDA